MGFGYGQQVTTEEINTRNSARSREEEPPAYLSQSTDKRDRKEPPRGEDGKYLPCDFLRMLGDRVLVFPDLPPNKTEGGILLPDEAKEKPRKGTVMAVGPGKRCEFDPHQRHGMDCKVGDRVFFQIYSGGDVTFEGVTYRLMTENEVISVIEPEHENDVELSEMEWRKKRNTY